MAPRLGPAADSPDARALALAEALDGFSAAFAKLAEAVRMPAAPSQADPAGSSPPDAVHKRPGRPPAAAVPSAPPGLSDRQAAAWARPELHSEAGVTSGELAKLLSWKQPNADQVLKRLEALGHITRVPDERPHRWVRRAPSA